MRAPMKIAVAGATGRVGRYVVDVLEAAGHDVVKMSRSTGVDVITGDGLADALAGVECVIDVATGPSPEQRAATEFFTTATRNLHEDGVKAGVQRMIVVSIIGIDRLSAGYNAAKVAHERAMLLGQIPVRILRAAQFHEFVPQLMEWGRQGEVSYVPKMRTQLVAARTVAEALADPDSAVRAGGPPSRPGRHPRRPDVRAVARLHVLTISPGHPRKTSCRPANVSCCIRHDHTPRFSRWTQCGVSSAARPGGPCSACRSSTC
jgi:nucleoside-diphosphate-sugar epimerase